MKIYSYSCLIIALFCLHFCNGQDYNAPSKEDLDLYRKIQESIRQEIVKNVNSKINFKYYSKLLPHVELSQKDVEKMNLADAKIAVYSHGYPIAGTKDLKGTEAIKIKDALLSSQKEPYDLVVLVDWVDTTSGIVLDETFAAKIVVPVVASEVKRNLLWLKEKGVPAANIDLIGHSMGAHVCGQAGKSFWKETGEKVAKIIGLDPAGRDFKEKEMAPFRLGKGDAVFVKTINTNRRFGYYEPLGDENDYPDVGFLCPSYFSSTCEHGAAKDVFIMELNGVEVPRPGGNSTGECTMSVILVLDVSPSMKENNRFQTMETSSKRLVSSLRDKSCIAIVIFGGHARITLSPTIISGESSRKAAMGAVPSAKNEIGATSIGAGMKAAIDLMNSNDRMKCAHINLITDGEENTAPYLRDVAQNIPPCTKVSSIALGNSADKALEGLSASTGGSMSSVSDLNSLNKLWRTEWDSMYSSLPALSRPVRFPVKELSLSGGAGSNHQDFIIDGGAGKNNHWILSHPDYAKLNPVVRSPSGKQYTGNEFIVNDELKAVELQVENAEEGKWSVTLGEEAPSKSRRKRAAEEPVVVFVTAEPSKESIVIDAKLTSNTLDYTIPGNVSILARLSKGETHVIIKADVKALLVHPTNASDVTTVILRDDGVGADEFKNDGIYSRYLTEPLKVLPQNLRYEVTVIAEGREDTRLRSAEAFEGLSKKEFDSLDKTGAFEREITAGSIRPINNYIEPPPSPVRDLKVEGVSLQDKTIKLSWTATGKTLDEGKALTNNLSVSVDTSFKNVLSVSQNDILEGSLIPVTSGEPQSVTLNIPADFWEGSLLEIEGGRQFPVLYFQVSSEGSSGRYSEGSNIASTSQFAMEMKTDVEDDGGNVTLISVIIVVICGLIGGVGGVWYWRKRVGQNRAFGVGGEDPKESHPMNEGKS